MPVDWPIVPLEELTATDITYGVVKPGPDLPPDVLFVRGGDIAGGRVLTGQLRTISREVSDQYSRTLLRGGELLVSLVGNPGQVAIAPPQLRGGNIARQVGLVRLRESVDARFVQYFLTSPDGQDAIGARSMGSVQQVINLRDLRRVPVPVPALGEQRAIAHILASLDDKIDLNRGMNETLEALARAIFKSWFVDFDPVRAKMEGRRPVGMDADTAALFPDRTQESEIGEIPKGWTVHGLDGIADFLNGLALQKYPPIDGKSLPVIKIAQLRARDTTGADRASNVPAEYIVDDGDILFSWSGSLLVDVWCSGKGALNQHLFKVTSERTPKWFFLHAVLEHLPRFQDIAADKATTMGHIQRRHLTEAKMAVPPQMVVAAADKAFAPLLGRIIASRLESRTLAVLRDSLLPKLLSGELRIPNAEKMAEAAL